MGVPNPALFPRPLKSPVIAFIRLAANALRSVPPANDEPFREEVYSGRGVLAGWQVLAAAEHAIILQIQILGGL